MNNEMDSNPKSEIILYQPNETVSLEVRLDEETVWLSQAQMAELFGKDQSVIARHISNVFKEGEQEKESNMQILHNTLSKYKPTTVYSLDVIISVGYRVKSQRGVLFRKWANSVLKEYLLRGYAINHRFERIEQNIQEHFQKYDDILQDHKNKIDFFVRTALPPVEGIFFDGQIFDAYELVCRLIKSAKHRIVLIDNYIDESTLLMLEKRNKDVTAIVYTHSIGEQLQLDIDRHNAQYRPITVLRLKKSHDRFLILDDEVYHIGASLKDLGKQWFAIMKMNEIRAEDILGKIL